MVVVPEHRAQQRLTCCQLGDVPFALCMMQAYDSGDGMMAARLWWTLTVAGHPSAMVLEGGW
jgi:hypothetical protein